MRPNILHPPSTPIIHSTPKDMLTLWTPNQGQSVPQLHLPTPKRNMRPCGECSFARKRCDITYPYSAERCKGCTKAGIPMCSPHKGRRNARKSLRRDKVVLSAPGFETSDVAQAPTSLSGNPFGYSGVPEVLGEGFTTDYTHFCEIFLGPSGLNANAWHTNQYASEVELSAYENCFPLGLSPPTSDTKPGFEGLFAQ
ncbi:hypothetical protein M0805_006421 [Coniferiporia weirii]|nr:hypothetical protein M0805_006421 [Coniferiporia weirii]